MSHRRFLALAAGDVLEDLDPDERSALERHLLACASCRRGADELREVAGALGAASPRRTPPPEVWQAIRAAISEPAPPDRARQA
ncbi:MAG: zf-HC2 domain-containing protein [Candidatus Limnocylindrales bacterium]